MVALKVDCMITRVMMGAQYASGSPQRRAIRKEIAVAVVVRPASANVGQPNSRGVSIRFTPFVAPWLQIQFLQGRFENGGGILKLCLFLLAQFQSQHVANPRAVKNSRQAQAHIMDAV